MKKILAVAVVFFILFCGRAWAAEKMAFVNIAKAFDDYNKTKDFDEQLKSKQGGRDTLVNEVKKLRDGLELLNDKAKQDRQKDIDAKEKELREISGELLRERDKMAGEILKEIEEVIKDYSKKNGFSVVFNDRVLLYAEDKLEITQPIIDALNARYKK